MVDDPVARPLIITEGKTDWKHLKAALVRLRKAGEFQHLDVEFLEYEDDLQMGDAELLKMCRAYCKTPQDRVTIFVFDRDNPSVLKDVQRRDGEYKDWGNNVFSFALPVPSHRHDNPEISIEFYYKDTEITRADLQGRRFFLSTEFDPKSGLHRSEPLHCMALTKIRRSAATIVDNQVFDRTSTNVALPKDSFANYVLNRVVPFDDLDVSEFVHVFWLIRSILTPKKSAVDTAPQQSAEQPEPCFSPDPEVLDIIAGYPWRLPKWRWVFQSSQPAQDSYYLDPDEVSYVVQLIESTLESFGIPANVIEVNEGPVFDQYLLDLRTMDYFGGHTVTDPQEIEELRDDLAVALAPTHSIQIQYPVPNRPHLLGILLEKPQRGIMYLDRPVSLPGFLLTPRTSVALGQFIDGSPAVFDLGDFPHLLIAGGPGAGKSVCLDTIMTCLLLRNTPAQLKLVLADPVGLDFVYFAGAPHLLNPVVTTAETFLSMLQWVDEEFERRANQFSKKNVRNIKDFNANASDQQVLPLILVVINELPDLVMPVASSVLQRAFRKLQVWHRVGIHAIFITRRPQARVIADLVQACPMTRIAFRMADRDDGIAVLGADGAQELLGRGDMLLKRTGESVPQRIQGCFVREDEIKRAVDYWRQAYVSEKAFTSADATPESGS